MRFPLRLSHLRHMDMPYGTLPDPVQVVFSGIAPGQVIAATAFLPDTMTVGSAAWRARPSGPDCGLHRAAAYIHCFYVIRCAVSHHNYYTNLRQPSCYNPALS